MLTDAQLRSVRMLAEYIAVDSSVSLTIRQCAERILQIVVPPVSTNTAKLTDPIWDSRNSDEPVMPSLPGTNPLPGAPPPLPGDCPQPTAAQKAAIEALWNTRRPLTPSDVMNIVNLHPELITIWAAHARFVPVP